MAIDLKGLCRLCAKSNNYNKEMLETENSNVLTFVEEVVNIKLNDEPKLPTKICLECEEKMMSFQMFILECKRVQDNLKKMLEDAAMFTTPPEISNEVYEVKTEHIDDTKFPKIKYEDIMVKDEDFPIDDIVDSVEMSGHQSDASYVDDLDNMPLSAVKLKTKKKIKSKPISSEKDSLLPKSDKKLKPNVEEFVSFECMYCQKKCSSWYTLNSHSVKQHKTAAVVQCVCGIFIKSKSVLYKHIADHKNPNVLSCDKCPRVTKTLTALQKHKLKHVPKEERVFKCNDCPKTFQTKEAVKSHMKSHIPINQRKVFHCDMCDMKFTTRSSAASHRRVVHEKIKSYVCDLCGYSCGTSGELKQHRAIHSDDKPFVCATCNKSFKTYSNLKTHMDIHDDTSYICYVCNRVLNSRRTLKKHLLVHEEKCRHICSYCNKAFKRRQTLKVHMYTHTGDKPLSCRWCEERFAYASTLRSHRLRCHPEKMAPPNNTNNATAYIYKNLYDHDDLIKPENIMGYPKNEIEMTRLELK